jgi:hypothetical protein
MQTFNNVDDLVMSMYDCMSNQLICKIKVPLNMDNDSRCCILMSMKKLIHEGKNEQQEIIDVPEYSIKGRGYFIRDVNPG